MEGVGCAANLKDEVVLAVRNSASYHPTVWGDYFIVNENHLSSLEARETLQERVGELQERVKSSFEDAADDMLQSMELVDSIQLLGLDCHFEREINEVLSQIHDAHTDDNFGLYEVSLRFRLLREHGYHVSSNVFMKFKDGEGGFIAALKDDARGLLSLYNAAFLGTKDDIILDQVIPFATCQLTSLLNSGSLQNSLALKISLALDIPFYRRMSRLLARKYIPIYEEDAGRSDTILRLAKLDFNLQQSLHRMELHTVSSWWRDLGVFNSLPYARDRLVECYYWINTAIPAPQFSRARLIATKVMALLSIADDTYDNYSTIEESQLLTEAIERWDVEAVEALPLYIKDYYLKLISTFEGFKNELKDEEKYRIQYLIDEYKNQCKYYFKEAKWCAEKYVPRLDEYLHVAVTTVGMFLLTCSCYVGMGDVATKEAFDWAAGHPNIVRACGLISRLQDDISSHQFEQQRSHVASSVECYMKEHGITDENDACKKLLGLISIAWKEQTEECFYPTPIPKVLLEVPVNFSRSMEDIYKYSDTYTHSNTILKDQIALLFIEPVPV